MTQETEQPGGLSLTGASSSETGPATESVTAFTRASAASGRLPFFDQRLYEAAKAILLPEATRLFLQARDRITRIFHDQMLQNRRLKKEGTFLLPRDPLTPHYLKLDVETEAHRELETLALNFLNGFKSGYVAGKEKTDSSPSRVSESRPQQNADEAHDLSIVLWAKASEHYMRLRGNLAMYSNYVPGTDILVSFYAENIAPINQAVLDDDLDPLTPEESPAYKM